METTEDVIDNVQEEMDNYVEPENGQQEQGAELASTGLDEQVANELNALFEQGMMKREELDQRAIDGLKGLGVESALQVLEELKGCNLQAVSNKSAYMCGIMKSLRQKMAAGLIVDLNQKRPGPDEAKLKEITDRTGYSLEVSSGQRKYGGPPPNYEGPAPGPGQEVFCGKLPNNIFEEVLIPLFENCGTIWDLRLMMDPTTGFNKTFCFVTFTTRDGATQAVKQLDNFEIRPGKRIKVNISVAKVRLFVGNIPKQRTRDEIMAEFSKISEGLKDVIVYANPDDPSKKNRGFAFLDYDSHKNAAGAKRKMEGGQTSAWNRQFIVSWAEPQDEPDEETMAKVKVLYVKNLKTTVTEDDLRKTFEPYGAIDRVKKTKDYGFVHFENRDDALKAMEELNGTTMGESALEISLAKPPAKAKKQQGMQGAMGPGMGGGWAVGAPRGRGGRGRGRGSVQPMAFGGGGYGGGFDPYGGGYDAYGYAAEEPYYGYEDYSGYDYYGGDGGYGGYGGAYMALAAQMGGYGGRGGMGRGARGAAARGVMMRGAGGFGAARGVRGARGGGPGGRGGAARGGPGMKRKAPDSFQGGAQAKKTPASWSDSWSTPIAQQPLGSSDAQWYQDSWS